MSEKSDFMLVVISPEHNIPEETETVNALFASGMTLFHLRKPEGTIAVYESFLSKIKAVFHSKIVVHEHYRLALKYPLKGIHMTSGKRKTLSENDLRDYIGEYRQKGLTVSSSFHSIAEIESESSCYNYGFLSPVFDSISKANYFGKHFDIQKEYTGFKIIALGGVDASNIGLVRKKGYDGAAVKGAIWDRDDPLGNYNAIRKNIRNGTTSLSA